MSTWFTVVARVAQINGIVDSAYSNALCEFEEGLLYSDEGEWRTFNIAFYGDMLEIGKAYIIFGNARLPGNTETDAPMVSSFLL
jgi:hypothetical protein